MKVGIAGAGVLGRLLAWRLARSGHRVSVIDPAPGPMREGSSSAGFTAAGLLSPIAELDCGEPRVAELGWRSLQLWPRWLDELQRPVHYRRDGSWLLAHAGDLGTAARLLARLEAHAPEHRPEAVSPQALQAHEPVLARGLMAWQLKGEGQIHTVQALEALADAGREAGVDWRWGRLAGQVGPGQIDGEGFDLVFDVRGLGAKPVLPLRGVRGELLWLHAPGVLLKRPVRVLHPRHRVYLVPRPGDLIVVGASEIESEDLSPVSVRSMLELLSAAHSVLPALAEARVVRSETNLRPALPNNLPLLQREPGLMRINGLFRHGWLAGPALVEQAMEGLS